MFNFIPQRFAHDFPMIWSWYQQATFKSNSNLVQKLKATLIASILCFISQPKGELLWPIINISLLPSGIFPDILTVSSIESTRLNVYRFHFNGHWTHYDFFQILKVCGNLDCLEHYAERLRTTITSVCKTLCSAYEMPQCLPATDMTEEYQHTDKSKFSKILVARFLVACFSFAYWNDSTHMIKEMRITDFF